MYNAKSKCMMDDYSRMPFGKYKNTKMANVPAAYLIWLFNEGKCSGEVRQYIQENLSVLKEEVELEKKTQNQ